MNKIIVNNKINIICAFIIFFFLCVLFFGYWYIMWKATLDYNKAVDSYNEVAMRYNVSTSESIIDYVDAFIRPAELLHKVDEDYKSVFKSWMSLNSVSKIKKDTQSIYEYENNFVEAMKIVDQLKFPQTNWVQGILENNPRINETGLVTLKDNPDGLLHKNNGGYESCIYFSVKGIDQTKVKGKNVVEKGVDAGGAIEIYANVKDAENRCEYLSQFDGTILFSGTYVIVGTMVIRTSFLLSDEDANELIDSIITDLTKLDYN